MVSAFSHSDVSLGVNEPGLKYELKDGTLTNTVVQGVSNEFRDGVDAAISVEHGTLIVTFPIEVALPQVSRFRIWRRYRRAGHRSVQAAGSLTCMPRACS